MNPTLNSGLKNFYDFFQTYGTTRLDGLDESYFVNLTQSEQEEAWNFLKSGVPTSYDHIKGLYVLDRAKALSVFKEELEKPIEVSPYPNEQKYLEQSRLLMLSYIIDSDPERKYIDALTEFAYSESVDVRTEFSQSLPTRGITPKSVEALKKMIFTETEILPRSSAIKKLMAIHGMTFKLKDPVYNAIYLALRSGDPKSKLSAMTKLNALQEPDYL